MAALTKADLAEMLFDDLGLNKREAREIVEMFYAEISEALEKNDAEAIKQKTQDLTQSSMKMGEAM